MVRRTLLVAAMLALLWAGPASAQTYGDILGTDQGTGVVAAGGQSGSAGAPGGDLPRTGQDNVEPLLQVAVVLLGTGMLLVLMARRRHTTRHTTAL